MKKYVIFDVDGTLNQTDLYAVEAYQKALLKRSKQVERKKIISCIGLSPAEIIVKLFGCLEKAEQESWYSDIEAYELALMKDKARPFNGVEETLQQLKTEGYGLAICSNAYPKHIRQVLVSIGLIPYFDEIASLDDGHDKAQVLKKLLARLKSKKACIVGDRKFDIEAARLNQIPVIGCAYGYAPQEIQNADFVAKSPLEIPAAVKLLI